MRDNAVSSVATALQTLSAHFRDIQSAYLQGILASSPLLFFNKVSHRVVDLRSMQNDGKDDVDYDIVDPVD